MDIEVDADTEEEKNALRLPCVRTRQEELNRNMLGYYMHKLDQEPWLCRTHLDDFLVKIWTILDHTRTRLNMIIKAIILN